MRTPAEPRGLVGVESCKRPMRDHEQDRRFRRGPRRYLSHNGGELLTRQADLQPRLAEEPRGALPPSVEGGHT